MKKLKLILIGIAIVLLGIFLIKGKPLFEYDFGKHITLSDLTLMTVDNEGNYYGIYTETHKGDNDIVASHHSYVMKVTPDHDIVFALSLKEDESQQVRDIVVDKLGRIYVHYVNYVYDMIRIESEEIVMYSPNGREIKGLYKHTFKYDIADDVEISEQLAIKAFVKIQGIIQYAQLMIEERLRYQADDVVVKHVDHPLFETGKIKYMEMGPDDAYLYMCSVKDDNTIVINQIYVKDDTWQVVDEIPTTEHKEVLQIAGYKAGALWYITADGHYYYVNEVKTNQLVQYDDESAILMDIMKMRDVNAIYLEGVDLNGDVTFYDADEPIIHAKSSDDRLTLGNNGQVYYQNDQGLYLYQNQTLISQNHQLDISRGYFIWQIIYINLYVLLVVLIALMLYLYYKDILKKKLSVVLKQSLLMLIIFSLFAVIMMGYIESMYLKQAEMVDGDIKDTFEAIIYKKLEEDHISKIFYQTQVLAEIKVVEFKVIESLEEGQRQEEVQRILRRLKEEAIIESIEPLSFDELVVLVQSKYESCLDTINALPDGALDLLHGVGINRDSYFITLYHVRVENDAVTYASTIANSNDADPTIFVRDIDLYVGNAEIQKRYIEGAYVSGISDDEKWIRSGRMVHYNDHYFIFRIGMNTNGYKNSVIVKQLEALESTMKLLIIFAVGMLLIAIRLNLNSIKVLTNFVNGIKTYDDAPVLELKSQDEIGDLSLAFNNLLADIKAKFLEQIKIYNVYSKYVPKEFESYLGKSILELELGDFCEEEMTVMYFYVHEMFDIIESFGNQKQAFLFIKEYLDDISKIIREHEGVVTRYDDGGITAIFENNEMAVKASIAINQEIKKINEESGGLLKVGIGLNRGKLLLGVVGESCRMQLSIISKHSNIAFDLAKRTIDYSAHILMTRQVMQKDNKKHSDHIRYLGYILPLNSDQEIMIYDLYESDDDVSFDLKMKTKKTFDEGLKLYHGGSFMKARYEFRKVIDINHDDLVARKYYFLADEYKLMSKNEIPNWSPVLK